MAKEIKKILKKLKKEGWEIDKRKNHYLVRHPTNGNSVLISNTPSCPYALANIKADIKRASEVD